MKILILCGHGKEGSSYDPGATGCGHTEATETIKYGNLIAKYLRQFAEVDVYEGNMYHRLFGIGGSYNFKPYDYVLECHLNAAENPAGHGTEIFVTTYEQQITVEQSIMKHLSKYFTLRDNDAVFDGVKRFNWGVINAIKTQDKVSCALLELCFITNQSDMNTYQTKLEVICKDIADGIAEGFKISKSGETVKVPANSPIAKPEDTSGQKDISAIAKEVIAGKWGNGEDRKNSLTKAGYDYNAVQKKVNELYSKGGNTAQSKPVSATPSKKSINTIAKEVLAGKWGNGNARKIALEKAGYNFAEVQKRVNELVYGSSVKSVETIAKEVIAGKWGNGEDRKNRLTKAGYDYNAVQKKVNELL